MELLLLWIAFGIVCAVIAPSRNRSAGAWLALGILFSVFALIALLALPKARDPAQAQPPSPSPIRPPPFTRPQTTPVDATKICPDCAETIKAAAKLCRFCGHKFGEQPKRDPEPAIASPPAPTPYARLMDPPVIEDAMHRGYHIKTLADGSVAILLDTRWWRYRSLADFDHDASHGR